MAACNVSPGWRKTPVQLKGRSQSCVKIAYPPNRYDACLEGEQRYLKLLEKLGGLKRICKPHTAPYYPKAPWIDMPPQGKEFNRIGVLPLPAVEGVDYPLFLDPLGNPQPLFVDFGNDGVVNQFTTDFTGTNWVEGSGDIVFRLQVRRWYPPDYGAVTVRFGSLTTPQNLPIGIRVYSGGTIQIYARLGPGALTRLTPGNIICSVGGWFYPQ
jgi:hypothetical protein